LAERAAIRVGLDVAGVDYITKDISRSYKEVGGGIVEINSNPGLDIHVWFRRSETDDVGAAVLELKFPEGEDGTVPTVLVAGDRGTGKIARATGDLLREKGFKVGLSLKRSAYLGGQPLEIAGGKLAEAPQILLSDPSLECLVGAVSLRRSAMRGLNLEACDVAAILPHKHNKDLDVYDQGMDVVIKANRGRFVVSTRNTAVRNALAGIDPERVILVSAQPDDTDARSHVAAGRCAVIKTWDSGRPHLTLFENGKATASTPLQDGTQARPKDVEIQLFAFALACAVAPALQRPLSSA
jgi:cyanophycin synthetase